MAEKKVEKFLMESDQKEAAAYTNNYLAHRVGITPKESTQIYDQWVTYEQVPLSKRSPRARLLVVRFMSDINQPSLPHSFSFCSCVYFCLYGPFNCNSFHKFSPQLFAFSLCSSGLISVLLVLSTIYLFMKVSFSPDMILCG